MPPEASVAPPSLPAEPITAFQVTEPQSPVVPLQPEPPVTDPKDPNQPEKDKLPERTRDRQIKEIGYAGVAVAGQIGKQAHNEYEGLPPEQQAEFNKDEAKKLTRTLWSYAGRDKLPSDGMLEFTNADNKPYRIIIYQDGRAYKIDAITGLEIGAVAGSDVFTLKLSDENGAEVQVASLQKMSRNQLVGAFLNQFLDKIAPTLPPEQAKMLRLYQAVLNNEAADLPPDTDTTLVESANQSGLITADHLKGFVGKLLPQKTIPADAKPELRSATEATNAENAQKTAAVEKVLAGVKVIDYEDMEAFCDVLGVNTGNVAALIADARTRVQQRESYIQTDDFKKKPEEAKIQIRYELAQAQAEAEVYEQAGNALHEGNAFGEFFYRQAHGDITPEQGQTLAAGLQNGDTEPLIDFALSSYEKQIGQSVKEFEKREKFKKDFKHTLETAGSVGGLSILFLIMMVLKKPQQQG